MTEENRLSKVEILIQQKKFDEAEKLLSNLLREDSNNINFLFFWQRFICNKINLIMQIA